MDDDDDDDDADPVPARMREVCLALPESIEVDSCGRRSFRAGTRFTVCTGDDEDAPLRPMPRASTQWALLRGCLC